MKLRRGSKFDNYRNYDVMKYDMIGIANSEI
jgi:hypothetical protein